MTDLIPVKRALIGWMVAPAGMVSEAFVLLQPLPREDRTDGLWPLKWRSADRTHGACFRDWMNGDHDMTPEWVFSEIMVSQGFISSDVAERAIAEFAKIDHCAWVRAMVPTEPNHRKDRRPDWVAH